MTRRGKGEGCVYRRRDGRWAAVLDLGWQNGRRRRKFLFAHTRREAHERLVRALRARALGAAVPDERLTVGHLLTRWLDHVRPRVRPRTFRSYEQVCRVHLIPAFGAVRLARLRPDLIERVLREKQRTLSPRTCQYLRVVLRVALNCAIKWQLLQQNPAALAEPPRVPHQVVPTLTPDDARRFLASLEGHRLAPLVAVALACGLRQGEILGLRWQDVDLDRGVLHVRHALERVGPGWRLVEPKSATSRRSLPLPAPLVALLRAHRRRQGEQRLAAGARWGEHGFVFTSRWGAPLDGPRLTATVKQLLARAGLPPLRFHALRHSAASLLLAQGVPARVVAEILGHRDVRLTLNTYTHVVDALRLDAAQRVETVLWGRDGEAHLASGRRE
ncbi:MAG TPA: site-specific integrase [Vicinamibacterales bacterium]|nr:site-specific integrase [Vicinamibacterales bacterium]